MNRLGRRQFLSTAAALGASAVWAGACAAPSGIPVRERRDLYPEGVASGDPDAQSVLLWTRRPFANRSSACLRVEVSEDAAFDRVVATARAEVSTASDWTCRVLVGNLQPSRVYWYRFIDEQGNASRTGRTLTAPSDEDGRPVRFAFVSCQNINVGALHAYRRMIFEDERAPEAERLGFVLHLGDFIYEAVLYPEDNPRGGYAGRPVRDIVRYDRGEKIFMGDENGTVHVPATLDDYRAVYRAYLRDPDLQDARARWPFVCIWDNHEFSWAGWQSMEFFHGENRPAQTRKVAACQAWFEYQPARIKRTAGHVLETFVPPRVQDAAIQQFDDHGFGEEPNNRAAVASLTCYRALRWGRHVEVIVTDLHSYRSEPPTSRAEARVLASGDFPLMMPQEVLEILDAGRAYDGGNPPATIRYDGKEIPNFRKDEPPQTLLGSEQKAWFLQRLRSSKATWKIWGHTIGTLDQRGDPANLPAGLTRPWPGAGYAGAATAYHERVSIHAAIRDEGIAGFAVVSGNRHSFWAGLEAPSLPPHAFEPVGVAFVTGALSSPGTVEYLEQTLPSDHPLRAMYLAERTTGAEPEATVNIVMRHGVRSALEYARTGDVERARALSNRDLAPHLKFLDHGGHGYSTVRVTSDALECEFVCIPRPIEPNTAPDGGPLRYRVVHRAPLWKPGERPLLEQRVMEGNPALSV